MTHSLHVRMQVEHELRWQSVFVSSYILVGWIGVFAGLIQSLGPYVSHPWCRLIQTDKPTPA